MVNKRFYLLAIVGVIFALYLASAGTFEYHIVKLDKNYAGGENIRGNIRFNFTEYPARTEFRSSWGNSISLLDLIRASGVSSSIYNCSTDNCSIPYVRSNTVNSLDVRNGLGLVGLTLSGVGVDSIRDSSFSISSGLASSCNIPLTIVIGDEKNITLSPTAYVDIPCDVPQRGCFDRFTNDYVYPTIPYDGNHYCERISLGPAPAYRLGAGITQSSSGSSQIVMSLFSIDGSSLSQCILPSLSGSSQDLDCIVPYSSPVEKEYYVCVEANSVSAYKIKAENNNPCGTSSIGSSSSSFDYDIYAIPLQYDTPSVTLNDSSTLSTYGVEFSTWIQDYIFQKYRNNCQPYCVVPISLKGLDQTVSFSNVNVVYDVRDGFGLSSNNVYAISKGDSMITGKNIQVDLSKSGITVPNVGGQNDLVLYLGSSSLIDTEVNISVGFDFTISPLSVPYGVPVTYKVNLANITKTKWNFGDGSGDISSGSSSVTHSVLQTGFVNISVEATNNKNAVSKKVFGIYVGDAKQGANETISLYDKRISRVRANITQYPLWVQNVLSKEINITELSESLDGIKTAYASASNDSDYREVMTNLLSLNVPDRIAEIRKEEFPITASLANIDSGLAESASGDEIYDAEQFRSSLGYWTRQNIEGKINLKEISGVYDFGTKTAATIVSVRVTTDSSEPYFFLFSYSPGDVVFSQTYNQKAVLGGTSIPFQGDKTFDFAVADSVTLDKLGAYVIPQEIAPLLENSNSFVCRVNGVCESDLGEDVVNCPSDCNKTTNWKLVISLIVLFVLAAGAAVFIWTWYKKRFERTLYKNPRDFYNITTFIVSSRKAGTVDSEIRKKLKKAGWTFDQIHYAFSKTKHEPERK